VWIVFDGIVYRIVADLIQEHSMEAFGRLRVDAVLSGWNCGLKLDGTWGLGRAIRLDGQWCLNRGWRVGQTWPRGIIVNKLDSSRALDGTWQLDMVLLPHHKILDCRLETQGLIRIDAEMSLLRSRNYFQVAADSPVPLDGDYQLGRVCIQWPDVTTDAVSSFDRDVYFGGTASELPTDVVYCGALFSADDVIYPELFRIILLGGSAARLPNDIVFSGNAQYQADDVIDYGLLPLLYRGM